MASVSMFDVSSAPSVTVSPLPLRVKRSASHHAGALPVSLMTSSSSMTAFYDLTARDSEEGDEWIHRVLDISELESHGTRAAPWLMESGCVETDLREDPEALEEFVRHLGLRKFEIRRLVRALHLRAGTKSDLASTAGHRSPSCPHEVSKPLCVGDWKPHHATTTLDSDGGEDCNNRTWADYDVACKLEGRHDSKRTTASRVEDEKKWAKWIESDSGGIEHGCKLHSVAPSSSNESYGVNSACEALCVCDWKPHDATTTLDSDAGEDCNNRAWADYDVACKLEGRHDPIRTTASRVEDRKKWAKRVESDSGGIEQGCKLDSVAPSSSNESSGVNSACEADCCTSKIVAVSDRDRNGRKPRSPLRPTSGNEESESVATARPTHGMRPRRSSLRAPPRKKDSGNWPAARKRAESLPSGRRVRIVSPRFQADEKTDSWDASWSISSNVPGVAIYSMGWSWLSTLFGSADEDQVLPNRTKSADEVVCDELAESVHLL